MSYYIDLMSTIGENIKKLRRLRGLKQEDLANALGVSQSTITGYETNYRKPEAHNIPKIAKALGVSINELYSDIKIKEIKAKPVHGNSRETKIQQLFSKLPPQDQRFILKQVQAIAGSRKAS
jgi:transcriptional regulator with XRE-family HTH domain